MAYGYGRRRRYGGGYRRGYARSGYGGMRRRSGTGYRGSRRRYTTRRVRFGGRRY